MKPNQYFRFTSTNAHALQRVKKPHFSNPIAQDPPPPFLIPRSTARHDDMNKLFEIGHAAMKICIAEKYEHISEVY